MTAKTEFFLGVAVSYAQHPQLWPIIPLPVLLAALDATIRQESNDGALLVGDEGRSVGLVHFYDTNLYLGEGLSGADGKDWRWSPYSSGVAAVRYIAEAVALDYRWAVLLLTQPYPALRGMWRYGTSPDDYEKTAGLKAGSVGSGVEMVASEWERPGRTRWEALRGLAYGVTIVGPLAALATARKGRR